MPAASYPAELHSSQRERRCGATAPAGKGQGGTSRWLRDEMTHITSWHSNTTPGNARFHSQVLKWSTPGHRCINGSELLNRSQLRPIYKKDILVIAPTKSYPTPAVIFHHASLHSLLMSGIGILPVAMVSLFAPG